MSQTGQEARKNHITDSDFYCMKIIKLAHKIKLFTYMVVGIVSHLLSLCIKKSLEKYKKYYKGVN